METSEVVTQILDRAGGAVLEKSRFGRSERALCWVKAEKLSGLAAALKGEAGLDWLENLSAMQVENELLFTYFVRSSSSSETLMLRTSVPIGKGRGPGGIDAEARVSMPSVSSVWAMAALREDEISRLLGVSFSGGAGKDPSKETSSKDGWEGFPLRKSFEVIGAAEGPAAPGGVSP